MVNNDSCDYDNTDLWGFRYNPCGVNVKTFWNIQTIVMIFEDDNHEIVPHDDDVDDDDDEQATTSGKLGLRVCGFQRYSQTDGAFQKVTIVI